MPECERITKPWEDLQGRKDWDRFKWDERTWFVDTRIGKLVMAEIDRDRDTGEITGTRETRPRADRAVEYLTHEEFEEVFAICKKTDCTIMEAVIELRGEENLPKVWVQAALNAPEVRYKYAKSFVEATTPKVEPKVFVSPLKKQAPEPTEAPARPEHWQTRKKRLAAEAAATSEAPAAT